MNCLVAGPPVLPLLGSLRDRQLTFLLKLLPFPVESVFVSSSVDELLVVRSPLGVASKNRRRGGSGVRDLIGRGDEGGVEVEPKEAMVAKSGKLSPILVPGGHPLLLVEGY